ncbi:RNA polymerase subunit sigma-24 [Aeromicrobium sp. Root236]|uniref:RNA polymerase sigma factor n=1 Tax=Aeromicrobium sp. Root236 TaxID=1736498 RepID=UPI0006FCDFA2|nr:sigma-70 family RNA polymerase sigma factor [Aeromicrobium sp. Root236]KRC64920.1 RNA polymerase subunit sigma-24 [Aeromicrobium sp. Root236]
MTSRDHDERFRTFYAEHFDALLAYAVRRVPQREDAADVVADTFLVAWRRVDELPPGDEARLWLYGVARKVLFNLRRSRQRRDRLGLRLRHELAHAAAEDATADVTERIALRAALSRLGEIDREVLTLTVWEELEPREIAQVLGLSAQTVRTRLSRARARLREQLGNDMGVVGHVLGVRTEPRPEEGR